MVLRWGCQRMGFALGGADGAAAAVRRPRPREPTARNRRGSRASWRAAGRPRRSARLTRGSRRPGRVLRGQPPTHPSGATDRRPLPRLVEASAPLPRPVHAAPSFRADGSPASLEPKAKLFQSVDPAGGRLTGRALERRVVLAMKLYDRTADTVTVDEIERIVI